MLALALKEDAASGECMDFCLRSQNRTIVQMT